MILPIYFRNENGLKRVTRNYAWLLIAGGDEQLGNWDAGAVPLDQQDDGSWETEAVNADGVVPGSSALTVVTNVTVNILVPNWRDILHKDVARKVEGQITGVVNVDCPVRCAASRSGLLRAPSGECGPDGGAVGGVEVGAEPCDGHG